MKADRAIKTMASACLVLVTVALLAIRASPASGYEPSIYAATPPMVWASLLFSIACGIGIIVHQVCGKQDHSHLWIIGLALILLSNTIVLSLHILRGYALWCASGDPGSHLGIIQDLIAKGHITEENFYPVTHIYLAQLSQLLDVNPWLLLNGVPVLFGLLSMVFMYFLAKSLLPGRRQVMLATVTGTALVQGWYLNLTPNHLANLAFPLMLFLLVRSLSPGTRQWKALFILIVFLAAPFHPVPCFALFVVLVALWLPEALLAHPLPNGASETPVGFKPDIAAPALLSIWGVTWLSSFYVWNRTILNVHRLITEGGPTYFTFLIENISEAQAYGYSIVEYFFKAYGDAALYIILALAAFPILLRRSATEPRLKKVIALYGPLAVIAVAMMVFYFLRLGFGPTRLEIYVVIISSIVAGFMLSELIDRAASRGQSLAKAAAIVVAVLLFGVSANGILTVYPSPYINSSNPQTTLCEIHGVDWFFSYSDNTTMMSGRCVAPGRFWAFLRSGDMEKPKNIPWSYIPEELYPPAHLGYGDHDLLGQAYSENVYLVLNQRDRMLYAIYPKVTEYQLLPSDFVKLENDPSVDSLYSNSGLNVWYVHATD